MTRYALLLALLIAAATLAYLGYAMGHAHGAIAGRRFRDWVRAWDEVELEPWQ